MHWHAPLRESGDQTPIMNSVTADTSEEASQQMRGGGHERYAVQAYSLDAFA